jgi:hypothetical protein
METSTSFIYLMSFCPHYLAYDMIHFTYNIPLLTNITNMFGNLLNRLDKDAKARIRIGVFALCRVLVTGHYIWLPDDNRES